MDWVVDKCRRHLETEASPLLGTGVQSPSHLWDVRLSQLNHTAERARQAHLVGCAATGFEQFGTTDEDNEALRAGGGDV